MVSVLCVMRVERTRGIVYCFTNKMNGFRYIGKTIDEYSRMRHHRRYAGVRKTPFYNAVNKYGWESFEYSILFEISGDNKIDIDRIIKDKEVELIQEYDSINKGYNLTKGGDGCAGVIPSPETRRKMSEVRKKIKRPKRMETKAQRAVLQYSKEGIFIAEFVKISVAAESTGVNNRHISRCCKGERKSTGGYMWRYKTPNYPLIIEPISPRTFSRAARENMRQGQLRRDKYVSPQTRGKLRAANLGRKRSLETRAKLSAMRKGKKWTAEMHERRREYIENKKKAA